MLWRFGHKGGCKRRSERLEEAAQTCLSQVAFIPGVAVFGEGRIRHYLIGRHSEVKHIAFWLHHAGEGAAETDFARNGPLLGWQLVDGAGQVSHCSSERVTAGLIVVHVPLAPPSQTAVYQWSRLA